MHYDIMINNGQYFWVLVDVTGGDVFTSAMFASFALAMADAEAAKANAQTLASGVVAEGLEGAIQIYAYGEAARALIIDKTRSFVSPT